MIKYFQAPSELQKTKAPPSSNEYVLDQLCICEEKLMKLLEDLESSGKDTNELIGQMEIEEVQPITCGTVIGYIADCPSAKVQCEPDLDSVREKHNPVIR